jgi:hypothetical protein
MKGNYSQKIIARRGSISIAQGNILIKISMVGLIRTNMFLQLLRMKTKRTMMPAWLSVILQQEKGLIHHVH